jgi:hypothetical protein
MCNDHPQLDGIQFTDNRDDKGELVSVTCIIHRKDRKHPTEVTEYLAECKRATDPWKMANRMLRHKALIQCARVAFGFSGIHDEDEARDIGGMRNVTPSAPSFVLPGIAPDLVAVEEIQTVEGEQ